MEGGYLGLSIASTSVGWSRGDVLERKVKAPYRGDGRVREGGKIPIFAEGVCYVDAPFAPSAPGVL